MPWGMKNGWEVHWNTPSCKQSKKVSKSQAFYQVKSSSQIRGTYLDKAPGVGGAGGGGARGGVEFTVRSDSQPHKPNPLLLQGLVR